MKSNIGLGKCHLFFGCRCDEEFIYNRQLTQSESEGVVELHLAQNRQKGKPKKYVQGALEYYGEEVASLQLTPSSPKNDKGVHLWQCQDGGAVECSDACIELLAKYDEMSVISATHQWFSDLRFDDCWQFDK